MQKHCPPSTTYMRKEPVFDRLYRHGLKLYEKKAKLIEKNENKPGDPQCTFQPNLDKKIERLRRLAQPARESKENTMTPTRQRRSSQLGRCATPSPRSRFVIQKDINNIEIRGLQKSFLVEARQAALRRSKEFNERYYKLKTQNYAQEMEPLGSKRSRLQQMLLCQTDTAPCFPSQPFPSQLPSVKSVKVEASPIKSRTPNTKRKDLSIFVQDIDQMKSMISKTTSASKVKNSKAVRKGTQPNRTEEEELSSTLQQCIQKAMLLGQALEQQLGHRHK